jgi:hypothetical protein
MILVVTLIILDLLAIWALIISRRVNWVAIVAALLVVGTVNFMVASAFGSGDGWPVKGDPAPGLFEGCVVKPGQAIYIIDVPTKQQHPRVGYISPVGAPRLYQQPYSQQLEKMCNAATKAGQQGVPQVIGKKTDKKGSKNNSLRTLHFHFYKLPPASLGTKP